MTKGRGKIERKEDNWNYFEKFKKYNIHFLILHGLGRRHNGGGELVLLVHSILVVRKHLML